MSATIPPIPRLDTFRFDIRCGKCPQRRRLATYLYAKDARSVLLSIEPVIDGRTRYPHQSAEWVNTGRPTPTARASQPVGGFAPPAIPEHTRHSFKCKCGAVYPNVRTELIATKAARAGRAGLDYIVL